MPRVYRYWRWCSVGNVLTSLRILVDEFFELIRHLICMLQIVFFEIFLNFCVDWERSWKEEKKRITIIQSHQSVVTDTTTERLRAK